MLLACFLLVAYAGGSFIFGFGVLFKPISDEFGWSRATTAGAFSLSSLEGGLEGLLAGPLIDHYGPRSVMQRASASTLWAYSPCPTSIPCLPSTWSTSFSWAWAFTPASTMRLKPR